MLVIIIVPPCRSLVVTHDFVSLSCCVCDEGTWLRAPSGMISLLTPIEISSNRLTSLSQAQSFFLHVKQREVRLWEGIRKLDFQSVNKALIGLIDSLKPYL